MPSYADIFAAYKDMLYRYAFKILKNEYDANDAVQAAFVRIFKVMNRINSLDDDMMKIYLLTIVKNTSLDIQMWNKKHTHHPLEEYDVLYADQISLESCIVEQLDCKGLVREILLSIKREYAEIIMLKYYCELDDTTIMGMLHINHVNLRVRLHRARNAVKSLETKRNSSVAESLGGYE